MTDSIDLDIIKFISKRENFDAYQDVITKNLCTKESWRLVEDIRRYYNEYPEVKQIDKDFSLWFRISGHPAWKQEEHELYSKIINNALERPEPDRRVFLDQLDRTRQIETATVLARDLRNGSITPDEFQRRLAGVAPRTEIIRSSGPEVYTLESISQNQRSNKGFYWRLEDLNKSIGPIRKGDFIVVGKRPEVGGTSFLVSEISHMLEQTQGNAVIFNNEEMPDKVYTRMVSSALDVDYKTMMNANKLYQQRYEHWLGSSTWDLVHDTSMTIQSIKAQLEEKEYDLIGINVLLKIGGTGREEGHDQLQVLGQECREIAQHYAPVIAIVQADPSAEGMRYIPQDRVYKSKTALQGESDAQIMIGKDIDLPESSRFIYVCRNKIPPAPCTDLTLKHIKTEVEFDYSTGRYTSQNYKGNSRND